MFGKALVLVIFVAILGSLGSALVYMVKDKGKSDRTVKALTLRIGLSIALFVFIGFAFFMGWIQPHGIVPPNP